MSNNAIVRRRMSLGAMAFLFAVSTGRTAAAAISPGPAGTTAALRYTITDLGAFGGNTSQAFGLSADGRVAGTSDLGNGALEYHRAFYWSRSALDEIGTLGGHLSSAVAVNTAGQVAGDSTLADVTSHAFLWGHEGLRDLGTFGGDYSFAYGLNDAGEVVGSATLKGNAHRHAFLWRLNTLTDLGTLSGSDSSALAISDHGIIVGFSLMKPAANAAASHACYWFGGRKVDLATLGGSNSVARAVSGMNDSFGKVVLDPVAVMIVGQSTIDAAGNQKHAFLWEGGKMRDISPFGSGFSDALGVNQSGQVVGYAELNDGTYHAYMYVRGTARDLNNAISSGIGWFLERACAINNNGEIVGYGQIHGHRHAFLLTPIGA